MKPEPAINIIRDLMQHNPDICEVRAIAILKSSHAEGLIGLKYNPQYPEEIKRAIAYAPSLTDFLTQWKITPKEYADALAFAHSIDIDAELSEED